MNGVKHEDPRGVAPARRWRGDCVTPSDRQTRRPSPRPGDTVTRRERGLMMTAWQRSKRGRNPMSLPALTPTALVLATKYLPLAQKAFPVVNDVTTSLM